MSESNTKTFSMDASELMNLAAVVERVGLRSHLPELRERRLAEGTAYCMVPASDYYLSQMGGDGVQALAFWTKADLLKHIGGRAALCVTIVVSPAQLRAVGDDYTDLRLRDVVAVEYVRPIDWYTPETIARIARVFEGLPIHEMKGVR